MLPVSCARAVLRDGTAVCVRAIRPDGKVRMRMRSSGYPLKRSSGGSNT